jgi:hypothetical protein
MRIGLLLFAIPIACAAASTETETAALTGSWGGRHIGVELTVEGGRIEYDCAHGTIDETVVPDREGRFEARGTHTAERGGPVREGEKEERRPARYRGTVKGKTLTLAVTLADSGEGLGKFTLTSGAAPRLTKCL